MATVEFAVVLIGLVVVLLLLLAAVAVAVTEVRVHEAARAGARSAARGETNQAVVAAAKRAAPGARVRVSRSGPHVFVTVKSTPRLGTVLRIPRVAVEATSVADREQR